MAKKISEGINNGIKTTSAKPLTGKKVWYFIQSIHEPVGSPAFFPAWQTEGTATYGGDTIDEQTKSGRILAKGTDEHSIELTQYYAPLDPSAKIVKDSKIKGEPVKVWRVEVDSSLAQPEGDYNVYPAEFGYGLVDELELSDGDDFVEASYTLNIVGTLKEGTFPLTDEDVSVIESVYAYQRPGETTGSYDEQITTTTTKATTTTTTTKSN